MKKALFFLFLITQFITIAQDYKFGKVSKLELQEKFYPLDSTAEAAYLFKKRRTYYNYVPNEGFQLVTECHERIKIYTKDGLGMANKAIVYYFPEAGDPEIVSSIKGYTFNLEGNKVVKEKLSGKSIFKEKINKYRSAKKIAMPNVKEGSVIELKYKITSPYYQFISDLQLQYHIPVKKLEYQVEVPEYFVYSKKSKGYYNVKLINETKSGNVGELLYRINVTKFDEENIPAIKDTEPFVANINNYRAGYEFELNSRDFTSFFGGLKTYSNTWENVSKQIYKSSSFGAELNKSSYYKDDLKQILATNTTEPEKLMAIFSFVKNQVKWNGFNSKYAEKGVRKAYLERTGNVADINLMLTAMLRSANFNADPVLVSTRANGIPMFPTLDGFNYVITCVELSTGGYVLLDATEPYSLPNVLPKRALNWNGRRVAKGGVSSWVKLTSSKLAVEENMVTVAIADDLSIDGIQRTKFLNLRALTYRKKYNHLNEEDVITALEEKNNFEIEDFKLINENFLGKPVTRNIKFHSEDLLESINGKLYIEPMLFLSQHTNPFKLEERKFPVDFATPWKVKNVVSIKIPEGYKVETLPESIAIGLPDNLGVFKFKISENNGNISTICSLQFSSSIISPQYYTYLKEFYNQLVKKESEKVVLVKI